MLPNIQNSIERARDNTVQTLNRPDSGAHGVLWLAKAGLFVPNWWSESRDKELRSFWKKSDHLSGAIYNMVSKMTAIPFTILSRDTSNKDLVKKAEEMTVSMRATAQFGDGWPVFFSRFVEDLITQDNGAFAEIIGPGNPAGPLTGKPIGFAHLDSARCQRTSDPEYPVLFRDDNGKLYKMHFTRVLYTSQMTSPVKEMNGVGFCAVSRCINVSQTLIDILSFKQEKLGSRPHRAILVTKGGLDPKDVADAFQMAESTMDAQGLSRYSKIVVAGSSALEDAGIDKIELSALPDGFDERTSVELGMATIALALGMDARELFPGMTSGASRADALVQHLKQRGKGPGQIIEMVEQMFTYKYLPSDFYMVFDYQDDAQDRQAAETRRIRSERMNIELVNGVMHRRTAREQMLFAGDIDQGQFEILELMDGRLEDGTDVINIFYRKIPSLDKFLDLGVEDPLDWAENDPKQCYLAAHKNIQAVRKDIETMKKGKVNAHHRVDAMKVLAGLLKVKFVYSHIINMKVTDPVEKLMVADDALAIVAETPELGQRNIPNPNDAFSMSMGGDMLYTGVHRAPPAKVGPDAKVPTPGNSFRGEGVVPSGNEQMSPRDFVKPRKADQDPTAKEAGEQDDRFPFGLSL